jgi:UDP:flavonoid glycosyltransferase YjiC (YdhE family)
VAAFDYAPFAELFPRADVIVHAGGVGMAGLAMRSGRPTLVVSYAHDQTDNAERVKRLGIARTVPAWRYTPARAAAELRHLLESPMYEQRASEVAEKVRQEDGVRAACDAPERLLPVARPGRATPGAGGFFLRRRFFTAVCATVFSPT